MKRFSQSLLWHSSLKVDVLSYGSIILGPNGTYFEPSMEQNSHNNEREKSESTKNTANDRTRVF